MARTTRRWALVALHVLVTGWLGTMAAQAAPALTSVTLTPTSPSKTDTLQCTAGSVTGASGTVTYSYAWTVNGATIPATASTLTGTSFAKGQVVRCTVTPSDQTGAGSAMTSVMVTIRNSVPTLATVVLGPSPASKSSTLTCTPSGAADPDSDSVSYTYAWKVNGTLVPHTAATLTGTSFSKGNTVQCTATPGDGTAVGQSVASNEIAVQNSPPSVASVTVSPAAASAAATLTCVPANAADADGDAVTYTYAWTVNGASISPTTSTLAAPHFSAGQAVACVVTPKDAAMAGTAVTSVAVNIAAASQTPTAPPVAVNIVSVTTRQSTIKVGQSAQVLVTLSGPAPASGTVVTIAISDAAAISAPSRLTIAGGQTSASFDVRGTRPARATVELTTAPGSRAKSLPVVVER